MASSALIFPLEITAVCQRLNNKGLTYMLRTPSRVSP